MEEKTCVSLVDMERKKQAKLGRVSGPETRS
jgi:hypothetical protein